MLESSFVTLNIKRALVLRFLAAKVPSFSHFLKLDMSRRALPLFQESPVAAESGSFVIIVVVGKVIEGDTLNLPG